MLREDGMQGYIGIHYGETVVARVAWDCPQVGVLFPLLRNLVMDKLLCLLDHNGHKALNYADDFVILVKTNITI